MAAYLTIIVSALYSVAPVISRDGLKVTRLDDLNTTWPFAAGDSSAAHVLQFVTWSNLTEPQWTYGDVVFASISVSADVVSTRREKIELELPARRAVLECLVTGPEGNSARKKSETYDNVTYSETTWIYTSVPNECVQEPSNLLPLSTFDFRPFTPYGGSVKQLLFGANGTSSLIMNPNTKYPSSNDGRLDSCPSLSFLFGSLPSTYTLVGANSTMVPQNSTAAETQITHLACMQKVQELDTAVILLLPDLIVDRTRPPRPDEQSMRYIGNVHQFRVTYYLQNMFGILSSNSTFKAEAWDLGQFFAAIVHGKDGTPAEELVGEENIPRLTDAVSKMYGRYIAQVMSRKMRTPRPSAAEASHTTPASLVGRKDRLVQHPAPKLVLQILLGLMMLCRILS